MDKVRKIEMDYSEKWGKNVEDAVQLALADLGVSRDQVEVIVLEEPSKGFFGIGSKLAKVRVEKKSEQESVVKEPVIEEAPKKKEEPAKGKVQRDPKEDQDEETFVIERNNKKEKRKKEKDSEPSERGSSENEKKASGKEGEHFTIRERPADLVEVTDHPALTFLREVTEKMGLTLSIRGYKNDDCVYIDMEGKDSGTIIGKRGQTLDAIQYLTSLVVNKDCEKYIRVVVDAENYREKRERTLEQLANRLADKVKRTGKSVRLEPMNPYERKVIHAALQRNPHVTTRSEGEEPYRRVVIETK